jgi:hypothetical protein
MGRDLLLGVRCFGSQSTEDRQELIASLSVPHQSEPMQPGRIKGPQTPVVPLDLWRELYTAAARFHALAPWRWMDDVHILGIENEQGVRLLSFLGAMEEVFGLASYRGTAGANALLGLLSGEMEPESPEAGFGQDSLLMDFVPRKDLRKEDLAIIRELEFKPIPGKPMRFPEFYSHKPGYVPWFIDEIEARTELDDLGKALRFAELLRNAPEAFEGRRKNEFPFFPAEVREPLTLEQFTWHVVSAPPPPEDPPVGLDGMDVAALSRLPQAEGAVWEVIVFYSMMPIGEGPRPYWPKLALVVDGKTGMILECKLSGPASTMAYTAALGLQEAMRKCASRPATVKVGSAPLVRALTPLARELSMGVQVAEELPMAEEARRTFEQMGDEMG